VGRRGGDRPPLVLVGGFKHELNSFSQGTMSLDHIRGAGYYAEGAAIFDATAAERPELAAIAHVAAVEGLELLPTVSFYAANAGGPVEHAVYERVRSIILDAAREHRQELDAIMLPLHGAMVTTQEDDPEGDLLVALREIVGPDVPIAATFDTHVHGTPRMARAANALVSFKTHPHVDHYQAATQAMGILVRAIRGEIRPITSHRKLRMMTTAERQNSIAPGAYRDLIEASREMEQRPGVLAVSIFTTQPWLDLPDVGWSVEVVTDDDPALGASIADELGRMCWDRRAEFLVNQTPISEALDRAAAAPATPVILVDGSDSTTAGGAGDGTELLEALLARPEPMSAALTVTDAAGVAACIAAGLSASVELEVGGSITPTFRPVRIRGVVTNLSLGRMALDAPWPPTDIGRMAVVEVGPIHVILSERKPWHLDAVVYRHVGRDPSHFRVVQVKSAGGFRARYAPIAAEVIEMSTTGPCDSDLTRMPFRRITRPIWPWDADLAAPWADDAAVVTTGDVAAADGASS